MQITEARVYARKLPMAEQYNMSSAAVGEPDTTLVELVTDSGHSGWGEVCPSGPLRSRKTPKASARTWTFAVLRSLG